MKSKQNYSANGYTFTASSLRGAKQIVSKAFWNGKIKGTGWLNSYVHLSCEGIEVSTYCTIGTSTNWLDKE